MKKKTNLSRRSLGAIFMIFALVLTLAVPAFSVEPVQAASKKTQALKAYSNFLSKSTINWNGAIVKVSKCKFTLVYIDKDSVPELLVDAMSAGSYHTAGYFKIYGYRNGKVVDLVTARDDFTYYKKSGVLATRAFMRGESWSYYRLSGGKATYFLGKFTNLKTQYNNAKFKTISKSTLNKTLKKYTKGKKAVKRIKTYANTKANRKKYLK